MPRDLIPIWGPGGAQGLCPAWVPIPPRGAQSPHPAPGCVGASGAPGYGGCSSSRGCPSCRGCPGCRGCPSWWGCRPSRTFEVVVAGAVQAALAAAGQRGDAGEAAPHGGIRAGPGRAAPRKVSPRGRRRRRQRRDSAPPASPALTPTPRAPLPPAARRAPSPRGAAALRGAAPAPLGSAAARYGTAGRGGGPAAPPPRPVAMETVVPPRGGELRRAPPRCGTAGATGRDRRDPLPIPPPPSSVPGTRTGAPRGGRRHRPVPAPRGLGSEHGHPAPQGTLQLSTPPPPPSVTRMPRTTHPEGQPQGQGHDSPLQPSRKAFHGVAHLHCPGRMLGWTSLTPAGPKPASPEPGQRHPR